MFKFKSYTKARNHHSSCITIGLGITKNIEQSENVKKFPFTK